MHGNNRHWSKNTTNKKKKLGIGESNLKFYSACEFIVGVV